jgi:hypothetical protein
MQGKAEGREIGRWLWARRACVGAGARRSDAGVQAQSRASAGCRPAGVQPCGCLSVWGCRRAGGLAVTG